MVYATVSGRPNALPRLSETTARSRTVRVIAASTVGAPSNILSVDACAIRDISERFVNISTVSTTARILMGYVTLLLDFVNAG